MRREAEREAEREVERRRLEEKERKERERRIAEQRREQERVRQEEARRREQERIRQEQERLKREQEERRRREHRTSHGITERAGMVVGITQPEGGREGGQRRTRMAEEWRERGNIIKANGREEGQGTARSITRRDGEW